VIPPQAIEIEESVLGSCLLMDESVEEAINLITPDTFYSPNHRLIFEAVRRLYSERKPVDALSVFDYLRDEGSDIQEGYLHDLTTRGASNIEHYCQILKEKEIKRRIINECTGLIDQSYNGTDVYDVIGHLNRLTDTVEMGSKSKHSLTPSEIFEREANAPVQEKIYTGDRKLDDGLYRDSGLKKGHVNLIIGESGHGKSSYSRYIAERLIRSEYRVLWFQFEGYDVDTARHFKENAPMNMDHLHICHDLIEIEDVKRESRTINRECGLDAIFFDYVQNIECSKKERMNQVEYISQQITRMARDLNVVVFPISQVSINQGHRSGWSLEPTANDVRWSKQLKQDADVITGIFRPAEVGSLAIDEDRVKDWKDQPHPSNSMWAKQLKNRHGEKEYRRYHMIHTDKGLKPYIPI
jgi:replicative DNA helicase